MYEKNITNFRSQEFVQYLQKLYNGGRLIMDKDWQILRDMGSTIDKLDRRSTFLKKEALIERFLTTEVEDFIVLSNSYTKLLSIAIDLSDYLQHDQGEDNVFEDHDEALACIEKVFLDIEKIKADNDEYLTKEFSDNE